MIHPWGSHFKGHFSKKLQDSIYYNPLKPHGWTSSLRGGTCIIQVFFGIGKVATATETTDNLDGFCWPNWL